MSEPGFVRRLGWASRRLFQKLWSRIRFSGVATSSSSSSSLRARSTHIYFYPPETTTSPYSGVASTHRSFSPHNIPYNHVSTLIPNVDALRGSTNSDQLTQNGVLRALRVINPDRAISSIQPLMPLPDLDFVTCPLTPLQQAVGAYLYHSRSSLSSVSSISSISQEIISQGVQIPDTTRYVPSPPSESESISRGLSSVSSQSGWSTSSERPISSGDFRDTSQSSDSQRLSPVNNNSARNSHRAEITGTRISRSHRGSFRLHTMQSLMELVEQEGKEWSNGVLSRADTASSIFPTPCSSWPWRGPPGTPSVPLPLTLVAGLVAQDRRGSQIFYH